MSKIEYVTWLFLRIIFLVNIIVNTLVMGEVVRLPECDKFGGSFSVVKNGYKIINRDPIRIHILPVLEHCIVHCIEQDNCQSICYHSGNKTCELHDVNQTDSTVNISPVEGWDYLQTKAGELVCNIIVIFRAVASGGLGSSAPSPNKFKIKKK